MGSNPTTARRDDSADRLWDSGYDNSTATAYECLDCGKVILEESHPGACPVCGGGLRNRSMPIE
ncbi:MAG: rubrerythrin-like domain-containing protein [Halobacteriota archaeon]